MKEWGKRLVALGVVTLIVTIVLHAVFTKACGLVNGGRFPPFGLSLQTLAPTLAITFLIGALPLLRWGVRSLIVTALPLYWWTLPYALYLHPNATDAQRSALIQEFWPLWFEGPVTVLVIWICYAFLESRTVMRRASDGVH